MFIQEIFLQNGYASGIKQNTVSTLRDYERWVEIPAIEVPHSPGRTRQTSNSTIKYLLSVVSMVKETNKAEQKEINEPEGGYLNGEEKFFGCGVVP